MLNKIKAFVGVFKNKTFKRVALITALCAATLAAAAVLGNSIHTVNINDGESTYTLRTLASDFTAILNRADLKSNKYRILSAEKVGKSTNILLRYTFPVYITVGDTTTEVETVSGTVGEILAEAGYDVDDQDMTEPSADTVITETAYIDYVNIEYVSGSYTAAIPCTVDTVYSNAYEKGTTKTVKEGSDGVQQVEYTSKVVNGETVETVVNNVTVLSNAVNGKQIVGTKKKSVLTSENVKSISTLSPSSPIELDENGVPVSYTKRLTVTATAYTYTGHNCATGVAPQPGYIAVNPAVIPYGTKMYIKSGDGSYVYGYAVAADTGGFTKKHPNNVDLFMSSKSACTAFGRRSVEIYILP